MVPDTERDEEVLLAVGVDVLTCLPLEDVGEQLGSTAAVVEYCSGFVRHRLVDRVLHPIIGRLHQTRVAARIVVRDILDPVEPGGHRQHVLQRHARLAVINVLDFGDVEIAQHRPVKPRLEVAPRDRNTDDRRGHRLAH